MTCCQAISVSRLIFLACFLLFEAPITLAGDKQEDPKVAQLRTELTSKNREPKVNNPDGGEKPTVAISRDFSWEEQARVRGEIHRLTKNPNEELVVQLLRISGSDYCVSTINDNEFIYNHSVGEVAARLAHLIIELPVHQAFADVPAKETNPYQKSIQLYDVIKTPNAEKLLTEDHLKLYQIQLKFLDANKAALQKKYPNDMVAAEVIKKIDAYHKTISENKKPMLQPIAYPILEEYFDQHELSRAKVITAPPK